MVALALALALDDCSNVFPPNNMTDKAAAGGLWMILGSRSCFLLMMIVGA